MKVSCRWLAAGLEKAEFRAGSARHRPVTMICFLGKCLGEKHNSGFPASDAAAGRAAAARHIDCSKPVQRNCSKPRAAERIPRTLAEARSIDRRIASGENPGPLAGIQSQTWMRTESGWKIVAAHVSLLEPPA